MKCCRQFVRILAKVASSILAFLPICSVTLVERLKSRRTRPAIFWGITPLINIKYHSEAIKRRGYQSATVVNDVYSINSRSDFDYLTLDIIERSAIMKALPKRLKMLLSDYWTFGWAVRRFDIFNFYFVGGILCNTPLKYMELPLLKLARKKTVFTAYGADVQVMSRFRGLLFKHAQNMDYPAFPRQEKQTLRDLRHFSKYADYIIAGADWVDYMPRWDKLIAGHFAIDTEEWKPQKRQMTSTEGREIVVLHAPNHREIKGTRFLIKACEELKSEGLPIQLRIVEKVPNARIRELMEECDIVADQFVVGWYALFALEGMSMKKPVMAYLRSDLLELYILYSYAGECPIVNTHPTRIKEVLRELVENPEMRIDLGKRGRAYVMNYHSLESVGKMFDEIYRRLWGEGAYS